MFDGGCITFVFRLSGENGLDLLRSARDNGTRSPAILLTGQIDHDLDIKAMEAGQQLHAYTVLQEHTKIIAFEPLHHGHTVESLMASTLRGAGPCNECSMASSCG